MTTRPRPAAATSIAELEQIALALERGGATAASVAASTTGTAGHLDRTPFIGGGGLSASDDDAAATRSRDVDRLHRAGLPRWLYAVTGLSVTVFAVGLVIYLSRDRPAAAGAGAGTAATGPVDAGQPLVDAAPPPPAPPTPPAGMVLVRKGGAPWLFVDARSVSAAEYARAFPKTKKPPAAIADQPVRSIPYAFARAYADVVHKRLLTGDEWEAAIATDGVIAQPSLFEWVAPAVGKDAPVRAVGKRGTRTLIGHKDVTFRLGQELPR